VTFKNNVKKFKEINKKVMAVYLMKKSSKWQKVREKFGMS